jgi:hypothetical protein
MQLFLRKGKKPPTDYRGRYTDENDAESITRDLADYQALKEDERAGMSRWSGTDPAAKTRPNASGSPRSTNRRPCSASWPGSAVSASGRPPSGADIRAR